MKIRHLPTSPKAGLEEHIENTVGRTLIALGHAEEVKLPARGSSGWLEQRLEQSAKAGAPDRQDVNPGFALTPEWGVRDKAHAAGSVLIVKKVGTDVTFFTEPQPDTPASVIARFEQLGGKFDGAAAAALEKARTQQDKYNHSIANARRW
jgi:hypothetical protein